MGWFLQVQEISREPFRLPEEDIDNTWFSLIVGGGENFAEPTRSLRTSSVEPRSPVPQPRVAEIETHSRGTSDILEPHNGCVKFYFDILWGCSRCGVRLFTCCKLEMELRISLIYISCSCTAFLFCGVALMPVLILSTNVMLGLGSNGSSQRLMDSRPPVRSHFTADGHPFPVRPRSKTLPASADGWFRCRLVSCTFLLVSCDQSVQMHFSILDSHQSFQATLVSVRVRVRIKEGSWWTATIDEFSKSLPLHLCLGLYRR
jgi:hypothetical protein